MVDGEIAVEHIELDWQADDNEDESDQEEAHKA